MLTNISPSSTSPSPAYLPVPSSHPLLIYVPLASNVFAIGVGSGGRAADGDQPPSSDVDPSPTSAEASAARKPEFTFVGTAADLKAYLNAQKVAECTDHGSYLRSKHDGDTARPPTTTGSADQEAHHPPRPGLTLGAVREVFYGLAGPEAAGISVADLPQALDLLGVPPVPEEVYRLVRQKVGASEVLGLADFVAFMQSVTA